MDNIQPIDNDEIEIDLKDLFLELVSFWKWILLAMILGAGIAAFLWCHNMSRFQSCMCCRRVRRSRVLRTFRQERV